MNLWIGRVLRMVTIAICDDEIKIGEELEKTLKELFNNLHITYDIHIFLTGEDLCRGMEAGTRYSLIFLDIEFAKSRINGVEVGLRIREGFQNQTTSIVYISWEKKYAMQLFEIRPLHFLVKPLEHEKIRQVINTYLMIAEQGVREFTYKKGSSTYKAPVQEIVYMENSKRKIIIHFADGTSDEFYGSLKEAYDTQLEMADFLFIHASYVVNYDYITAVKYNEVMAAGCAAPLPISPNKRNDIRQRTLAIIKKRKV